MKYRWHLTFSMLLTSILLACAQGPPIPTVEIEPRKFSHHITVEGTLQAAKATSLSVPSGIRNRVRLAWLEEEGSEVEEGQIVARFDAKPMEEELDEGLSNLNNADLRVLKSRVDSDSRIADHVTEQEVAEIELDYASRYQKVDEVIFSRNEIIESRIDHELATHRKDHATGSQDIQRQLAATEIELLAIDQRQAQSKIERAQANLEALEVRAPHQGILTVAKSWNGEPLTVGSEMWPGQSIGEIPNLDRMEAEVFVLEADAGGLEVGKEAQLLLEAQPEEIYPAKIKRIDAVAKPRFRNSPVQYFGVILEFAGLENKVLKPGQRVRATLVLEEAENALVVPRQTVFQTENQYYVYLRTRNGFVPKPVKVSSSSISEMVIGEGLSVGDQIALTRPAQAPPFEPSRSESGKKAATNTADAQKSDSETSDHATDDEKNAAATLAEGGVR